ncbi:DUF1016 N-terminal domain-containing protein [Arthrobacter silviterrae]|uniref:DUF1016 N-terminal domain-containing protein n=2 Tax=Arthrobacter silviterrae TaxID=2026658 RepID=UPI0027D76D6F|nr:DUF1016 N-terminal domain-containing protein [Arthrobacter silviterrae]
MKAQLSQLPWYHHIALMQKLSDPDTRLWYAAAVVEHGWSRNVLVHQIEIRLHECSGQAISNFKAVLLPEEFKSSLPSIELLEAELRGG